MQTGSVAGIEQAIKLRGAKGQGERRTAEDWAMLTAAQRHSGVTVAEFCRRHGVAKATFWHWRKRLLTQHDHLPKAKPAPKFLPVAVVSPAAEPIEVELGTIRVRLQGAEAARVVSAIVARIGSGAQQ